MTDLAQTWVLELPFTAPLTLNARMKWQHAHAVKKPWREAACVLARSAKIPRCQRVEIVLWYTPKDDRARDPLNLVAALKLCEDGLVDAGVIKDDSNVAGHVPVMPEITSKGPLRPGGNRLWLTVTRLA